MQSSHAVGELKLNGQLGATVIRADGSRRVLELRPRSSRVEKAPDPGGNPYRYWPKALLHRRRRALDF
jgi:hypothetical protein